MRISPLHLLCALLFSGGIQAQFSEDRVKNIATEDDKKLNWGYFLGLNRYGFAIEYEATAASIDQIVVAEQTGFQVGLIGEYRINNFTDLRLEPGLVISSRTLENLSDLPKAKSTYINLPLLLKVSAQRFANVKPYVVAGPSVSINLNSQEKTIPKVDVLPTKTLNYGYELGVGVDLYMPYFKFSPSIRGVFGQSNELASSLPGVQGIYTRGVFLMLTFE
ncbi:MAG: PorT protein [Bacteroidota bacterium]